MGPHHHVHKSHLLETLIGLSYFPFIIYALDHTDKDYCDKVLDFLTASLIKLDSQKLLWSPKNGMSKHMVISDQFLCMLWNINWNGCVLVDETEQ